MQKTLFDFAPKGPKAGNPAAVPAVPAGAGAAPQTRRSSASRPDSVSVESATAEPQSAEHPCRRRRRSSRSRSRSASVEHAPAVHAGVSRDDAILVDTTSEPGPNAGVAARRQRSHSADRPGDVAAAATARRPPGTSSRWLAGLITSAEWGAFLSPITADSWRGGAFLKVERFLDSERAAGRVVLPPAADIFSAFNSCPFHELKVVLLGQDPYHNLHQAHGLCFSVLPGVPLPPSLRNMYKELATDIPGFQAPTHGYLQSWAEQGMLLLNATLTVEAHKANSHSSTSGWPDFTDAVIHHLSQHHPNRLVFLLWGGYAQRKAKLIDTRRHTVLESVHPSPLSASRGWFGCRCFSACNAALQRMGHLPMYWQLPLEAPLHR
ncbi:uracil-DNA-glycosylase [Novymonas esmeraldas]|uniref:Uracil-DNA glycosylase n=1 Tax=Novymonas esmeraldas TaxID=1808958 RepID=A0AAW0EXK8_9TRYP